MRNGRRALFWAAQFALLLFFWFLYTASFQFWEVLVGVGAAALAATGSEAVRALSFARFFPYRRWILMAWRLPVAVLRGTWVVAKTFFGRTLRGLPAGRLCTVRFDPGGDDAPSATRRALAVMFTTFSPDSIVVFIDRRAGLMLVHLMGDATPVLAEELGARE